MKKVECCECGKELEVPDDLDDDEAVFCSKECIEREAKAIYMQEQETERLKFELEEEAIESDSEEEYEGAEYGN